MEEKIAEGDVRSAINKLKFDIKDKLEKWLVDDYPVIEPLQISKKEAIHLVEVIIDKLVGE